MSGATRTLARLAPKYPDRLGVLLTPATGNRVPTALPWACDNAAFSGFDPAAYCRLLGRAAGKPGLLWACVPDVVGDAATTLVLFRRWLPLLNDLGVPAAFVGQDGAAAADVPWDEFACWFIGGSTRWKLGHASAELAHEAKRRGKWVHAGRINSLRRLRWAFDLGCDSVDGTAVSMYADAHLEKFCRWVAGLGRSPVLFGAAEGGRPC